MIRKLFVGAAIAGLMSLGATLSVAQQPDQADKQEQKATKSISGKVAKIGDSGHSFSLEVAGASQDTMEFVVDRNTQVKGQVREGTAVTVEYQAMENGRNLAVTVTGQT